MESSCGVKHVIRSKSEELCMIAMTSKTLCHLCGGREGDLNTDVQAIFHGSAARICAVVECLQGGVEE